MGSLLTQGGDRLLTQGGKVLVKPDPPPPPPVEPPGGTIGPIRDVGHVVFYRAGPLPDVVDHILVTGRLDNPVAGTAQPRRSALYFPGGGGLSTSFQGGTSTNPSKSGQIVRDVASRFRFNRRVISLPTNWTWGDDELLDRTDAMVAYAEANYGFAPPYHLMAASMGAVCALNWAHENPSDVASISALIPMIDIQAAVDDNRLDPYPPPTIYPPDDPVAYGARPDDGHTPARHPGDFAGIPIKLWVSHNDTVAKLSEASAFVAGAGASAELVDLGNTTAIGIPGHGLNANFIPTQIADFVFRHDTD